MPKSIKILSFHYLANGGGGQNVHLNQCCRKFDEIPKSTKHFFFTVWPMVGQNVHLNQSCRKLEKCRNLLKMFHCLANYGVRGGSKCSP